MNFEAKRASKTYTFSLAAGCEKVFPLLCPKRELDWVPGWEYEMVYSKSGYNEMGCIFKSNKLFGIEMIWTNIEYDPEHFKIGFLNVAPGFMAVDYRIWLTSAALGCETTIHQIFTGLSEKGNRLIAAITESNNNKSGKMIEKALDHYLKTGSKIQSDFFAHFHLEHF